jgi:hypothetical protein
MASVELSRRVRKVVSYPPLADLGETQRPEFHEALFEAGTFEDLPRKGQAVVVEADTEPAEAAAHQQRLGIAGR